MYRFVFVTPIDFTCGCRKGIYIYIYTYNRNTLFGHFKRITLASGSSTRSIQTSGHNEKIFSRPLPSRGSRMDGNRCDATGNQTLPLWFVRFIGRVDLISLPVYILIDDTRSRCRACQESEWWDSIIRKEDQKEEFFSQKSIPPHKSPNLESLLRYYRVPANRMTAQKRDSNDIPRTFPQPFHREQWKKGRMHLLGWLVRQVLLVESRRESIHADPGRSLFLWHFLLLPERAVFPVSHPSSSRSPLPRGQAFLARQMCAPSSSYPCAMFAIAPPFHRGRSPSRLLPSRRWSSFRPPRARNPRNRYTKCCHP